MALPRLGSGPVRAVKLAVYQVLTKAQAVLQPVRAVRTRLRLAEVESSGTRRLPDNSCEGNGKIGGVAKSHVRNTGRAIDETSFFFQQFRPRGGKKSALRLCSKNANSLT